jgi:molybdate transport system substrate-binding protein
VSNTPHLIYRTFLTLVAGASMIPHSVLCADVRVMCSGAFAEAVTELAPRFEGKTNDRLVVVTTFMGVGQSYIPNRVRSGESVDVVILPDDTLTQLVKEHLVDADTHSALARSSIGVAVRAGAVKPDISSVDALKRTLLQARSIAYSNQVSGLYLSTELFPRLGIADEIRHKTRLIDSGRVGTAIARGEAEIGFQQISELLPIPGITYVGPLPSTVQKVTLYSGGVVAASKNAGAAKGLIKFLASPDATSIIRKSGLDPTVSP